MPSCVMRYCKNTTKNIDKIAGVTFHRFPRPNHPQREKWIQFVQNDRREDFWLPSEASRICSNHFQEGDIYTTKNNRRFLKSNAVPCSQRNQANDAGTSVQRSTTPLNVEMSDSESIFDTPRKIRLKHQLKKTCAIRQLQKNKIKNLQRQNYNLKKKNVLLIDIIKKLKQNHKLEYEVAERLQANAEVVELFNTVRKANKTN